MKIELDDEGMEFVFDEYLEEMREEDEEEYFNALILVLSEEKLLPSTHRIEELLSVFDNNIGSLLMSVTNDATRINANDDYFYIKEYCTVAYDLGKRICTFKDWYDFCNNHLTKIFDEFWESTDEDDYVHKYFFREVEGFKEKYINWLEKNGIK